jgi:hypothetical protein
MRRIGVLLPYEQGDPEAQARNALPTKFELVVNLKTAKAPASRCRRRCLPAPTR